MIHLEEQKVESLEIPKLDTRDYVWSANFRHQDYPYWLTKTTTKNRNSWSQILMDRSMYEGTHIWKILIEKSGVGISCLGVCTSTDH